MDYEMFIGMNACGLDYDDVASWAEIFAEDVGFDTFADEATYADVQAMFWGV